MKVEEGNSPVGNILKDAGLSELFGERSSNNDMQEGVDSASNDSIDESLDSQGSEGLEDLFDGLGKDESEEDVDKKEPQEQPKKKAKSEDDPFSDIQDLLGEDEEEKEEQETFVFEDFLKETLGDNQEAIDKILSEYQSASSKSEEFKTKYEELKNEFDSTKSELEKTQRFASVEQWRNSEDAKERFHEPANKIQARAKVQLDRLAQELGLDPNKEIPFSTLIGSTQEQFEESLLSRSSKPSNAAIQSNFRRLQRLKEDFERIQDDYQIEIENRTSLEKEAPNVFEDVDLDSYYSSLQEDLKLDSEFVESKTWEDAKNLGNTLFDAIKNPYGNSLKRERAIKTIQDAVRSFAQAELSASKVAQLEENNKRLTQAVLKAKAAIGGISKGKSIPSGANNSSIKNTGTDATKAVLSSLFG